MRRTKNYYQQLISIYGKRRDEIKERYGGRSGRTTVITNRIKWWRQAITRVEARTARVKELYSHVTEFLGESPRTSIEGRQLYYKWGLENRIKGVDLASYIGFRGHDTAGRLRKRFTLSFATKPANRELYQRFKLFLRDKEEVV